MLCGEQVSGEVDDTFLHEFGIGPDNSPSESIVNFAREQINNH